MLGKILGATGAITLLAAALGAFAVHAIDVTGAPADGTLRRFAWLLLVAAVALSAGLAMLAGQIVRPLRDSIRAAKQREQALQRANLYLDVALNNMIQGLCLFGPDQRLRLANERFGRIMGVRAELLRPGTALGDILAASVAAGNQGITELVVLGSPQQDRPARSATAPAATERRVRQLRPDCVVEIAQAALDDGGWIATFEDITERRQTEARIAFLARHDPLTGLANRTQLTERLQDAVATLGRGDRFAVMCLDVDHFKAVNDTLGHSIGDRLLQAAARRLDAAMRDRDTVCRLSADEFAVIGLDVERPEDAWELAQRLLAALAAPFDLDGVAVTVAASLGIALAPDDGTDAAVLLKNADTALCRAKQDGRGSYRSFEPDMDARLQARRTMELDLRRALATGQFALHYQPLVDAGGGQVNGFEALLRWCHPDAGMIPPNAFIPLAEEIGLIGPIGEWVLRTACTQAAGWPGRLKVAVNVSAVQFKDAGLVQLVADALAGSGLAPERLELEVTESVLLQNNALTLRMLHQLHEMGVGISLDDFGTGYSSLSYLRSFPFDKIKIDQSFVRDLSGSTDAIAIIRAITALGLSLGIRTTAEGVESKHQLIQLCAEGCDELQGYLFSRPIPPEAVPGLIDQLNANQRWWHAEQPASALVPVSASG